MDKILQVKDLKKHFEIGGMIESLLGEKEIVKAVDGVSFDLIKGETLALVGESGCGKSTIAKTVMGIHSPTAGEIYFKGEPLTRESAGDARIQMIFQDSAQSLNPRKTIGSTLNTTLKLRGEAHRRARIDELLRQVGIDPEIKNKYPAALSGGQKQRVAIARTLANDPEVIIADEPVSGLDVSVQSKVIQLLKGLQADHDLTILMISHDLAVVRSIADRINIMYLGEIVESGKTEDIFEHPAHPYTKSLLDSVFHPKVDQTKSRSILKGELPNPKNPPPGCRFNTRCPEYIGPVCENHHPELLTASENPDTSIIGSDHSVRCFLYDETESRPEKDAAASKSD